jgi:hypothetical protein
VVVLKQRQRQNKTQKVKIHENKTLKKQNKSKMLGKSNVKEVMGQKPQILKKKENFRKHVTDWCRKCSKELFGFLKISKTFPQTVSTRNTSSRWRGFASSSKRGGGDF